MGDGQRGAAGGDALEFCLDGFFRLGIKRRSGFIKNQDFRFLEQSARDGDTLLFTARELQAALAYHGLVTVGQGFDQIMNVC